MNRTNKVKISNRPNNIATINTHLLKSVISAKFAATAPKPGPKLFKQAATAVKAVMSSIPVARSNNIQIMKTAAYAEKKVGEVRLDVIRFIRLCVGGQVIDEYA